MAVTESTSTGARRSPAQDKSIKQLAVELKDLVLAYAKQETVDPLKALVRFVGAGVAGALLLAVGTVLGTLAIVRAVQTETSPHLTGHLSFIPYLAGVLFVVVIAVAAVSRIGKRP